jgi:hypothetical protein
MQTNVFFNDDAVDVFLFDLLDAFLGKGIILDGHGERERFAFPVPVLIIIQVFGVLVAGQRIAATPCVEIVGRVRRRIEVMFQESKVAVIDDLYHHLAFRIIGYRADPFCYNSP